MVQDGSPLGNATVRYEGFVIFVNVCGKGSVIGSDAGDGIARIWSGKDGNAIADFGAHGRMYGVLV